MPRVITHTISSRSWINRELQHFLGGYKRSRSGLYVMEGTPVRAARRICSTFLLCPEQLQTVAKEHDLTVSLSLFDRTKAGNSCTIYGAWSGRNPKEISPHLEIGKVSLPGELLFPHMVHELSHLFWKTRPQDARERYRAFLTGSIGVTGKRLREVTPYSHDHLEEFLEGKSLQRSSSQSSQHSRIVAGRQERWVEESFCETVAALVVPGYPFEDDWKPTIDFVERRRRIRSDIGLLI